MFFEIFLKFFQSCKINCIFNLHSGVILRTGFELIFLETKNTFQQRGETVMDFCAETNEVSKRKTACREALEQPIECDITLPEYLPDIQRVLKCSLTAHISSVQKTGDRVTADGTGRLSVLYMSDTGKLQCLEQGVPFSRFFENRAVEECECSIRAKTEYVNCRAVSGRRLDIHGSKRKTLSRY